MSGSDFPKIPSALSPTVMIDPFLPPLYTFQYEGRHKKLKQSPQMEIGIAIKNDPAITIPGYAPHPFFSTQIQALPLGYWVLGIMTLAIVDRGEGAVILETNVDADNMKKIGGSVQGVKSKKLDEWRKMLAGLLINFVFPVSGIHRVLVKQALLPKGKYNKFYDGLWGNKALFKMGQFEKKASSTVKTVEIENDWENTNFYEGDAELSNCWVLEY